MNRADAHPRDHFHPLEIIPFFRRFPATLQRDLLYTLIWSCLLGVAFYLIGGMTSGRLPSLRVLGMFLLVSSIIGYTIHGVFILGRATGLQAAAICRGRIAKVAYFTVVPTIGVLAGFWVVSQFVNIGIRGFMDPGTVIFIATTSFIISTILTIIFFWRERSALAEAEVARERARAERVEREAVLANLRALQAQIEPHFLFNTLANVTSLIDPDPAQAKRMLESFIRFLRASLAATRTEATTVGAEAELIAAYLDVLQVRMGARLRYRIDVPEELRAFSLPPMLLQPVVENAIRHGLEPKVDGGEVAFGARKDGAGVLIEIRDTGVGFAPTTRGGIGLTNLRDRLRLLYGERAGLNVGETAEGGTTVTLRIPA